jgi:glutamate-1-semialdehyde 2,1-aminomutase
MANRGIWEAIATAGPAASFAHTDGDIDRYLAVLDGFLSEIV